MNKSEKPQSNDALEVRKRLTFAQAEGIAPLPAQLQLGELSPPLRAALWAVVHDGIQHSAMPGPFGHALAQDPW